MKTRKKLVRVGFTAGGLVCYVALLGVMWYAAAQTVTVGTARVAVIDGTSPENAGTRQGGSGKFLVLRVSEETWVSHWLGTPAIESPTSWRSQPEDARLSEVDSIQAGEDAWIAASMMAGLQPDSDVQFYAVIDKVEPGSIGEARGLAHGDRIIDTRASQTQPGDVEFLVSRGDRTFPVLIESGLYVPSEVLGIRARVHAVDRQEHPRPRIPAHESGGSSGLVHALALLDSISEGDLTGGETIAVTGTITPLGVVGVIGGVQAKTQAAVRAGARVLLVPAGNFDDAVTASEGRIEVVSVNSLRDAVVYLCGARYAQSSACGLVPEWPGIE